MPEKKRKPETEAERSQRRDSAARLHELAEEALAKLPPHFAEARERAGSNAAWLRQLAEKAQAKLDPEPLRVSCRLFGLSLGLLA